jgi:hypothetical protein
MVRTSPKRCHPRLCWSLAISRAGAPARAISPIGSQADRNPSSVARPFADVHGMQVDENRSCCQTLDFADRQSKNAPIAEQFHQLTVYNISTLKMGRLIYIAVLNKAAASDQITLGGDPTPRKAPFANGHDGQG